MRFLSGGTLLSPQDILNSKIRIRLPGENSFYETSFKDFFSKESTAILESALDEQIFAHLKHLHSTLTELNKKYVTDESNIIEFLLPESLMPLNVMQDILPTDDEDI